MDDEDLRRSVSSEWEKAQEEGILVEESNQIPSQPGDKRSLRGNRDRE